MTSSPPACPQFPASKGPRLTGGERSKFQYFCQLLPFSRHPVISEWWGTRHRDGFHNFFCKTQIFRFNLLQDMVRTEYLNFAKNPHSTALWERHYFCISMCFDPVFVFVGGMLRILWQWDPWWGQRPKTSETVPLFSPWDRVTHIFHTCYTKRGKTLETHITVKQTHVNWGETGETWSL